MIVVLLNSYIAILALFVWLRFIPFNLFWKLSPAIVLIALLAGLFIPMGWGAPSGPAVALRNSVQIIPAVAGSIVDLPIEPNKPIKAGEVLFKIDPTPYQAAFDQYSAQLQRDQALLAKDQTNLQRYQQLLAQLGRAPAGGRPDVRRRPGSGEYQTRPSTDRRSEAQP